LLLFKAKPYQLAGYLSASGCFGYTFTLVDLSSLEDSFFIPPSLEKGGVKGTATNWEYHVNDY